MAAKPNSASGPTRLGDVGLLEEVGEGLDKVAGEQHEEALEAVGDAVGQPVEGQQPLLPLRLRLAPVKQLQREEEEEPENHRFLEGVGDVGNT